MKNWRSAMTVALFGLALCMGFSVPERIDNQAFAKKGHRTAEQMVAAGFKRFGVERGVLTFTYDGVVKGTHHLYFDHWGWREAKYVKTTTTVGDYREEANAVEYLDGERRYQYDPAKQLVTYLDSQQAQQMADKYKTKDMVAVGIEMTRQMGGTPVGKATVQGVECEVWKIEKNSTKLYMWKGITMGEESTVNGLPLRRTCTSMDTKKAPPADKLALPKGVKVVAMGK
jgi:hypothetical protein